MKINLKQQLEEAKQKIYDLEKEVDRIDKINKDKKFTIEDVYNALFNMENAYQFHEDMSIWEHQEVSGNTNLLNHTSEKEAEITILHLQWRNIAEFVEIQAGKQTRACGYMYQEGYVCKYDIDKDIILVEMKDDDFITEQIIFSSKETARQALDIFGLRNYQEMIKFW